MAVRAFMLQNGVMEIQTLGDAIRRARQIFQITQRELAQLCGVQTGYVSRWENDTRPIDDKTWTTLAGTLRLPRSLRTKLALDLTMGGEGAALLCPRRLYYVPPRDRKTSIRLLAFRRVNKRRFDELWAELKGREDWPRTRRFLLTAWADGRFEVEIWMLLLLSGLVAEWQSPQRCGYRILPYVDPRDRRVVGDCRMPALVRYHPKRAAVIFPQATLLAGNEVPRPDGLIGMRAHGRTRWCGYEHERTGVPNDEVALERSKLLQMPIIYLTQEDLLRPDFAADLWARVYKTLWPAGHKVPGRQELARAA